MNLLLINNEFPPIGGGGSTVTKYAISHLTKAGHKVTVVTSRYKDLPKREVIDGAIIIRIPTIRRYKDYCSMWELTIFGVSAAIFCLGYSFRHRIDFVQAYFAVPAGFAAWWLKILRGIPYAVYFGGSDIPGANPSRYKHIYPLLTPLLKTIWRGAEFRTVCSQELVELAKRADPQSDFLMIPNGVETGRFRPAARQANVKVKILFIGRLIYRKGLHRVIKALPAVRGLTEIPFELEVVGTGAAKEDLEKLAKEQKVADLVNFVGLVSYEELEKSYQGADVFVLTSLSEGMPSVILEAMGCGLPVITSDVGGNNEIVREGENGYLISGDNTELLAARLAGLINDERKRVSMGKKSREMALEYDWKNIMSRYENLYKSNR